MKEKKINWNKVRIIKEFETKHIFGELEFFLYQIAFGISIRYMTCENMGWMFRLYFGPVKLWFNIGPKRNKK